MVTGGVGTYFHIQKDGEGAQERVDERRSPIRGWSVKTSVEALSFQTQLVKIIWD